MSDEFNIALAKEFADRICSKSDIQDLPLRSLIRIGVYFLLKNDEIVYIGKSKNIYQRINTHIAESKKEFDTVKFIDFDLESLGEMEMMFIKLIKPKYNGSYKNNNETMIHKAISEVKIIFEDDSVYSETDDNISYIDSRGKKV